MLRRRGIRPARLIELGSNEAIAHAVAAGAGVALLPAVVLHDLVAMGRVRVVGLTGDPDILRPLYRLELANRPRGPALQAFVEMVRSEEHTSELQSLMRNSYAVFCLKKKTTTNTHIR